VRGDSDLRRKRQRCLPPCLLAALRSPLAVVRRLSRGWVIRTRSGFGRTPARSVRRSGRSSMVFITGPCVLALLWPCRTRWSRSRRNRHDLAVQAGPAAPSAAGPDVRATRDLWPAAPARPSAQNERETVWTTKEDGMRRWPSGRPDRYRQPAPCARGRVGGRGGRQPAAAVSWRKPARWRRRLLDGAAGATDVPEGI